ncbi:MAG: peroxiredoxin [Thermaerobacter sp.]|nr:peroxiredoxin [Thermaerobacter sp.]
MSESLRHPRGVPGEGAGALAVGAQAPRVVFDTEQGQLLLSSFVGHTVVVYFFPRAMTPGCTTEACDFRDRYEAFRQAGAVVMAVSPDAPDRHARFSARYQLPFYLATDPEGTVAEAFGVSVMKLARGVPQRSVERATFVVDGEGVVRASWRRVRVAGHADEVLSVVQRL